MVTWQDAARGGCTVPKPACSYLSHDHERDRAIHARVVQVLDARPFHDAYDAATAGSVGARGSLASGFFELMLVVCRLSRSF